MNIKETLIKYKLWMAAGVIIALLLSILISKYPQYKWGYFIKGPEIPVLGHKGQQGVKLKDGRIFVLGYNMYRDDKTAKSFIENRPNFYAKPVYIYNKDTNKYTLFNIPNDFFYLNSAVLLKDGKILFAQVYNYKKETYKPYHPYYPWYEPYNYMAVYNVETNKVEKYINKKLIKALKETLKNTKKRYATKTYFAVLGNGKVLNLDSNHDIAEIYDIENNSSFLIEGFNSIGIRPALIPVGQDEVYIFSADDVLKYDDKTRKITKVGHLMFPRNREIVVQVDNENFLVMGGELYGKGLSSACRKENELYNIKTNKSVQVGDMTELRCVNVKESDFAAIKMQDGNVLVTGGWNYAGRSLFSHQKELKTTDIYLKDKKIFVKGPNMKHATRGHSMFLLDNGDIFVLNRWSQVFKVNKFNKDKKK